MKHLIRFAFALLALSACAAPTSGGTIGTESVEIVDACYSISIFTPGPGGVPEGGMYVTLHFFDAEGARVLATEWLDPETIVPGAALTSRGSVYGDRRTIGPANMQLEIDASTLANLPDIERVGWPGPMGFTSVTGDITGAFTVFGPAGYGEDVVDVDLGGAFLATHCGERDSLASP